MYLDDILVDETPACDAPTALTITGTALDGASFAWAPSISNPANGYEWEVRDANNGVVTNGTATDTLATVDGLAANSTYTVYVRSDCGGQYSEWSTGASFYTGYCIPTGGHNNTDEILNFTLANLNHTSAPSEGTDGYMDYTGTVAPANLEAGTAYVASLTSNAGSGSHGAAVWIDYNDNMVFDAS